MTLAVSAGNTHIALGVFTDGELERHWRLSSRTHRTPDEFAIDLRHLLDATGSDVSGSVMCSVVPELTEAVGDGIASVVGRKPLHVTHATRLPVTFAIDDPAEIGGDLIANAVGGFTVCHGACVVVDFGTALSFTAVDENGSVLGVAIAPGIGTGVHGLISRTAALPMIDLTWIDTYIGTNTDRSLRSGIMHGFAGLVNEVAGGMAGEIGGNPQIVATGGQSELMARHCRVVGRVEPSLTLRGLLAIAEYNQST
jgi:type III pantothenate kinase